MPYYRRIVELERTVDDIISDNNEYQAPCNTCESQGVYPVSNKRSEFCNCFIGVHMARAFATSYANNEPLEYDCNDDDKDYVPLYIAQELAGAEYNKRLNTIDRVLLSIDNYEFELSLPKGKSDKRYCKSMISKLLAMLDNQLEILENHNVFDPFNPDDIIEYAQH